MHHDVIITMLKSKSLAITNARVIILSFLFLHKENFIGLWQILKMPDKTLNRITVYRTLGTLCDAGLIYKIIDISNKTFYAINKAEKMFQHKCFSACKEQFHFQCMECRVIICLPDSLHKIKLPAGFVKTDANLLLMGYCAACAANKEMIKNTPINNPYLNVMNA